LAIDPRDLHVKDDHARLRHDRSFDDVRRVTGCRDFEAGIYERHRQPHTQTLVVIYDVDELISLPNAPFDGHSATGCKTLTIPSEFSGRSPPMWRKFGSIKHSRFEAERFYCWG
jgi:hypothetical protein